MLLTIKRFAKLTGYSEAAVRAKISGGVWLQGDVWLKAPDGRILISTGRFTRWAEGRGSDELAIASRWTSAIRESAVGRD